MYRSAIVNTALKAKWRTALKNSSLRTILFETCGLVLQRARARIDTVGCPCGYCVARPDTLAIQGEELQDENDDYFLS